MSVEACPVAYGCRNDHPAHGQDECQVDIGDGQRDPQLAEQCPCPGACPECRGYGTVEYGGIDYVCATCHGDGRWAA